MRLQRPPSHTQLHSNLRQISILKIAHQQTLMPIRSNTARQPRALVRNQRALHAQSKRSTQRHLYLQSNHGQSDHSAQMVPSNAQSIPVSEQQLNRSSVCAFALFLRDPKREHKVEQLRLVLHVRIRLLRQFSSMQLCDSSARVFNTRVFVW